MEHENGSVVRGAGYPMRRCGVWSEDGVVWFTQLATAFINF